MSALTGQETGSGGCAPTPLRVPKSRGSRTPPRGTGGPYEVYVVSDDGFYVAGGTQQYTNKRAAEQSARDWLDSRRDVRAYVVTL